MNNYLDDPRDGEPESARPEEEIPEPEYILKGDWVYVAGMGKKALFLGYLDDVPDRMAVLDTDPGADPDSTSLLMVHPSKISRQPFLPQVP